MFKSSRLRVFILCGTVTAVACSPDAAKQEAFASGNAYYEQGQFTEAIIEYRRAIQIDSNFGEARFRLGEAYLKANNQRDAIGEFVRAADLMPANSELQIAVGNFMLVWGRFEDARSRADQVLKREPANAAAHVLRGNALAGLTELGAALDEMELALSGDPTRALTLANIGAVQLVRGDKVGADQAFAKAVEAEPRSPLIRLARASYLISVGRLDDAERELKEAYAIAPTHVGVNRALAVFYVRTVRAAEAEPYLKQLAAVADDDRARFSLARLYLALQRQKEAIRLLQELETKKSTAVEAKVQLAAILYGMQQPRQAHQLLDEALAISPTDPRAMLLRAGFFLDERKIDQAVSAAEAAVKGDFTLPQAFFVLGQAYMALGKIEDAEKAFNEVLRLQPRAVQAQLALSRLHLASGNLELAQEFAGNAATNAPTAPATREAIIRTALARGNLIRAETELKELLHENPRRAGVYILQGDVRIAQKNLAAAERAFLKARELAPRSTDATLGLVRLDMARGRRAAALAKIDALVQEQSKSSADLLLAARAYVTLNEWEKAEATFRRTLALDPVNNEAYGMLGSLYVMQGRLEGALKEFESIASRDPKSVTAHTMTGIILERQGRTADAKEAYRRALASGSNAAVAGNNLAWLLATANESLDEALQLAKDARTRLPNSADVIDTLGWIYYKRGLHSQAIEELKKSVEQQPANASFNYHLGLAYAKNGDAQLAKETLEAALKMNPKAAEVPEAMAALAQLSRPGS